MFQPHPNNFGNAFHFGTLTPFFNALNYFNKMCSIIKCYNFMQPLSRLMTIMSYCLVGGQIIDYYEILVPNRAIKQPSDGAPAPWNPSGCA
jgi:hypothetical protein